MTTDNLTTENEKSAGREASELTDLLTGVLDVIKEMREQIDYSSSLGDEWNAKFLESYCIKLEKITTKDS